jgi:hypothetical protein
MRDSSSGDKLKIVLFGDLSLEEAMDLSRDRQILELEPNGIGQTLIFVHVCQTGLHEREIEFHLFSQKNFFFLF